MGASWLMRLAGGLILNLAKSTPLEFWMIVTVYISADHEHYRDNFENGVNLEFIKCVGETNVEIKIVGDGDEPLLPLISIDFQELKNVLLKLE